MVVFFLPFSPALGKANGEKKGLASRDWAEAYVETNLLIRKIGSHLARCLRGAGHAALATPATHNFDEEKLVSSWSHKHVGYIAGLGTFGHHHQLITEAGCCGRLGSLLTTMEIPATHRPREEWCLEKAGRPCLACVSNCRYGALFETRFDRQACYRQCLTNDAHYSDLPLVDVCGKCACEVPCSHKIPRSRDSALNYIEISDCPQTSMHDRVTPAKAGVPKHLKPKNSLSSQTKCNTL